MKKRYSNIMLAMALGMLLTANATAQETEVTSKYVKNPSFEVNGTADWTQTNFKTQTNTSFTKKAGNTYRYNGLRKVISHTGCNYHVRSLR